MMKRNKMKWEKIKDEDEDWNETKVNVNAF